jgi:Zn finger protein HypA/HybF involved in hydrogenase expression
MAFVLEPLVFALVVAIVWIAVASFRRRQAELVVAQKNAERERQSVLQAAMQARRYLEGANLICLNCDTRFNGPLDDATGCPKCHTSSLCVTEEEYAAIARAGDSEPKN